MIVHETATQQMTGDGDKGWMELIFAGQHKDSKMR